MVLTSRHKVTSHLDPKATLHPITGPTVLPMPRLPMMQATLSASMKNVHIALAHHKDPPTPVSHL